MFATILETFKKLYPKVRVIIDCTEVYLKTPSSLEVKANLWSDYKHHCTSKFLVAITPNGAMSWISSTYGGCTSDVYIVRNSGFLDLLELYDTVPSSAAKGTQMTKDDVSQTNRVVNVLIFVEKAIARLKRFRILKNEVLLLEMPLLDANCLLCFM